MVVDIEQMKCKNPEEEIMWKLNSRIVDLINILWRIKLN